MLAVLGALLLFMAIWDRSFLAPENLINIVAYSSIAGLLAVGMTPLMISREFDISVGSTLVLAGVIAVTVSNAAGPLAGMAAGIASGAVMGLVNGWLVARAKINSFIATLGTMTIFQGVAFALTEMKPVAADDLAFMSLGEREILGLPAPIVYFAVIALGVAVLLRFTIVGKLAYAIGGNESGCRNLGIRVERWKIGYFVLCGLCASTAGVILASRLGAASATFGENMALVVISAVVLGGVPLTGGAGRLSGVVAAILLLGMIESMTIWLNIFGYYQKLLWALLLLGAVTFDAVRSGDRRATLRRLAPSRWRSVRGAGLLLAVGLTLLASCRPRATSGEESEWTLGVSMSTFTSPYASAAVRAFRRQALQRDIELILLDAQNDIQREAFNIDSLVAKKVDAILVNAVDTRASRATLRRAARKGFPVICFNAGVEDPRELGLRAYTGPKYYDQAVAAAEVALAEAPSGRAVVITGDPGYSAAIDREEGFTDTIEAAESDFEILDIQTANWMRENAQRVMSDFITRFGKAIDVIYCQDDNMAAGVINALRAAGYTLEDKPIVVSIGAMADGLPLVKQGWIDSTVMQSPREEARLAVDVAIRILEGEQQEAYREYFMKTPIVDRSNVDEVIALGMWD